MREVHGGVHGVHGVHVACSGLHRLLPGGHYCHHLAHIVCVDVGYVMQGLLRLGDDLVEGSEVTVFQIYNAGGHLTQGVAKVAQYFGFVFHIDVLRRARA